MKRNSKPSPTVAMPAGARRRRQALDAEIRGAFVNFLESCREHIQAEDVRQELDEDLRTVARLLERKAKREGPASNSQS